MRSITRGAWLGSAAAIALVVSGFAYFHDPTPTELPATVHNLLQEPLSADWERLKQAIGPDKDFEINSLHVQYAPDGTITELRWNVMVASKQEKTDSYLFTRTDKEDSYHIVHDVTKRPVRAYLPMNRLNDVITTQMIKSVTPSPADFLILDLNGVRNRVGSDDEGIKHFAIDGNGITGKAANEGGYLLEVMPMKRTSKSEASGTADRNYLIRP